MKFITKFEKVSQFVQVEVHKYLYYDIQKNTINQYDFEGGENKVLVTEADTINSPLRSSEKYIAYSSQVNDRQYDLIILEKADLSKTIRIKHAQIGATLFDSGVKTNSFKDGIAFYKIPEIITSWVYPIEEYRRYFVHEKFTILLEKASDQLIKINNQTGNIDWKVPLKDIQVEESNDLKFLCWYVIENHLWIPLKSNPYTLLEIDTGKYVTTIADSMTNRSQNFHQDPTSNRLIRLDYDGISYLDIGSKKISFTPIKYGEDYTSQPAAKPWMQNDTNIYFVNGARMDHVSKLNKTTLEVEDQYKAEGLITHMFLEGEYLFVLNMAGVTEVLRV